MSIALYAFFSASAGERAECKMRHLSLSVCSRRTPSRGPIHNGYFQVGVIAVLRPVRVKYAGFTRDRRRSKLPALFGPAKRATNARGFPHGVGRRESIPPPASG